MSSGGPYRTFSLRECQSCVRPRCPATSLGVCPTPGRSTPATSLIPLRARRALRSTSRRTRSSTVCGLGTVGMLGLLGSDGVVPSGDGGAAALGLQLQPEPADLPVERADLPLQP